MTAIASLVTAVQQRCRKAPSVAVQNAYARAARQFCGESRWLRYAINGSTVASPPTRVYSVGNDPNLEPVDVTTFQLTLANGKIAALEKANTESFNPNAPTNTPTNFAYVPEGMIALDPIPNAIYQVLYTLVVQPKEGTRDIPPELLVKWSRILEDGALGYLYSMPGEPWFLPSEGMRFDALFRDGINNAKADVAKGFQSGSTRARPRAFVTAS